MTDERRELEPCLFCGGEAEMLIGMHSFSDAQVSCKSCGADGGLFDESNGMERGDELADRNAEAAASAWNTRATRITPTGYVMVPEEPTDEIMEAIEAGCENWSELFNSEDGCRQLYAAMLAAASEKGE